MTENSQPMNYVIDENKVDEMVLALMHLGLHSENRSWKSFDWDSLNRLYEKNLISHPINKSKSIVLTEEGQKISEELFKKYFTVKE